MTQSSKKGGGTGSPDKKEGKEKSSKKSKKREVVEVESEVEETDPYGPVESRLPIWPNLLFT